MASAVILPKLGNTVETCLIVAWHKTIGDPVAAGDALCEVETDKAALEIASPASGTLLATFFQPGDEVAVLTTIAAVGQPGEDVSGLRPTGSLPTEDSPAPSVEAEPTLASAVPPPAAARANSPPPISPRARHLAARKGVDAAALTGTGPGGRIIERDVQAALESRPALTPVARRMVASGEYHAPDAPAAPGQYLTADQLVPAGAPPPKPLGEVEHILLRGARKVIAQRMLESLQTTAQLTLHTSADARALLDYRQRLKASSADLGLQGITITHLVLFAVSRTLPAFPALNALFDGETISQYRDVHLAFAVDTPRGLIVPVIRRANHLSLRQIAEQASQLAEASQSGSIKPDDLQGGTFTVTNLGSLGIERFTPVLNPPQVGILGVGSVDLQPVMAEGEVAFIPHIGLSLTINHQVIDGVPGAHFLQALAGSLADLALAL